MRHPAASFLLAGLAVLLLFSTPMHGQGPSGAGIPSGAKLYISPMDWSLDRYVRSEIERQGLPVTLVEQPADADFVMTGLFQSLGSHFLSPGHYIQVRILAAEDGRAVWSGDANDYAVFFGRLRPHGPARAAVTIVSRLRRRMALTASTR